MKKKYLFLLIVYIHMNSSVYSQEDNTVTEIVLTCDTISIKQLNKRVNKAYKDFNQKDSFSTKDLLEFIRIARTVEMRLEYNKKKKYSQFMQLYGTKIIPLAVNDESMDYVQQMGFVRYSMRYKMFISKPGKSHTMLCHNYYFIKNRR